MVAVTVSTIVLSTSPLLALDTVRVEGVERLDSSLVVSELSPLTGMPLARISPTDVANELQDVALIESVTTRMELPGTLVVSIVERTPIGVSYQAGVYRVIDRAAVVLFESGTRPLEFPLISIRPDPADAGFLALGEALAVVPPEVLAQIDQVSASSRDTVTFSLRTSAHLVIWGSSELSREKARALPAALRAAGSGQPQLIDLSTPDTVVIRDLDRPLPDPSPPAEPDPEENTPDDTPAA